MKITVPGSWKEMNDFQQLEIIHLINNIKDENFTDTFIKMVSIVLMRKKSIWQYLRMRWILMRYPISIFEESLVWLLKEPELHVFPKIKGLQEPAPRVGDFTAKQFSVCDTLLYRYNETKEEIILRQLVASLYRIGIFNTQKLPEIAKITDELPLKEAERIAFVFSSVRRYISDAYPSIFPKPKEDESQPLVPVFRKKPLHTPFSKIIVMMAADELKLLGTIKESENTLIYDFLNALVESKKIHKMKADAYK